MNTDPDDPRAENRPPSLSRDDSPGGRKEESLMRHTDPRRHDVIPADFSTGAAPAPRDPVLRMDTPHDPSLDALRRWADRQRSSLDSTSPLNTWDRISGRLRRD